MDSSQSYLSRENAMHAIFCSTVESTNLATADLSSAVLLLLVKFEAVKLTEDEELLAEFVVELSSYNLREESELLFVVEFYESVDDDSFVLLVLFSAEDVSFALVVLFSTDDV
jgi:hypothetical protein